MAQYVRHFTAKSQIEIANWLDGWIKKGYTVQQFEILPVAKSAFYVFALLYLPPATEDDFLPKRNQDVLPTR